MSKIGLFYATETGKTKEIAELIQRDCFDAGVVELHAFEDIDAEQLTAYEALILGTSTFGDGEYPQVLEEFLPNFDRVSFTGKRVALFGLGDQFGYPTEFVDAMGMLYDLVKARGASVCGFWPTAGYDFQKSKADLGDGRFCGLVIDEDNQAELTVDRLNEWIDHVRPELLPAT